MTPAQLKAARNSIQTQIAAADSRIRAAIENDHPGIAEQEMAYRAGIMEGVRHFGFKQDDFSMIRFTPEVCRVINPAYC